VNSLPKTVTRQRRDCDLNMGLSAPESSTLTTRLQSLPLKPYVRFFQKFKNMTFCVFLSCCTRMLEHCDTASLLVSSFTQNSSVKNCRSVLGSRLPATVSSVFLFLYLQLIIITTHVRRAK